MFLIIISSTIIHLSNGNSSYSRIYQTQFNDYKAAGENYTATTVDNISYFIGFQKSRLKCIKCCVCLCIRCLRVVLCRQWKCQAILNVSENINNRTTTKTSKPLSKVKIHKWNKIEFGRYENEWSKKHAHKIKQIVRRTVLEMYKQTDRQTLGQIVISNNNMCNTITNK